MKPSALRLVALASTLAASLFSLTACSNLPDSEEITGTPEETVGNNQGELSGSLPIGTTIISTTDVNLRSAPSTSASILHVVPNGSSVTVEATDPQSGFYKVKHNGTVGWSFANYYKAAPVPAATPVVPADLLAKLGTCQQLAGTTKFRADSGSSATIPVCGIGSSVIWWKADFDVDCDGGTSATCKADPDYQSETATVDSKGNPLDASNLPYVVIPGVSNGFDYKVKGLKMGSVVAVVYNNKISYGILGDVGPQGVIGEASYAMAKELGINPSPTSGGVDSGVTYVAFTGAAAVVGKKEDHAKAVEVGQAQGNKLIQSN